ncbi:hypothetical protein D3C80_2221730 [compost metagenome]
MKLDHFAGIRILDYVLAADEVCALQPHFSARYESMEAGNRLLHEIVAFDINRTAPRNIS